MELKLKEPLENDNISKHSWVSFLINLIYIIIDKIREKIIDIAISVEDPVTIKYPVSGTIECTCKHCNRKIVIFKDTIKKD